MAFYKTAIMSPYAAAFGDSANRQNANWCLQTTTLERNNAIEADNELL